MSVKIKAPRFNRYIDRLFDDEPSKDFIKKLDRGIKTIGGVDVQLPETSGGLKIFSIPVTDAYEFISLMAVLVIIVLAAEIFLAAPGQEFLIVGFALTVLAYPPLLYYAKLKKFQRVFLLDFADVLDTMLQGLSVGLPVEEVLDYVVKTKNNTAVPFFKEVAIRINAGQSLQSALKEVTPKTLSPEFDRMARVLALRTATTADITKSLQTLLDNINTEVELNILTEAEKMNVKLLFPIIVGYVFPFMMLVLYPLIVQIFQMNGIGIF
ncbi:MAG TPA: type II secretion system F family protein [Thermoanaerobacter sp.]|nr:type II secretion system F family protein [Thermoanaerobacter sp.]